MHVLLGLLRTIEIIPSKAFEAAEAGRQIPHQHPAEFWERWANEWRSGGVRNRALGGEIGQVLLEIKGNLKQTQMIHVDDVSVLLRDR